MPKAARSVYIRQNLFQLLIPADEGISKALGTYLTSCGGLLYVGVPRRVEWFVGIFPMDCVSAAFLSEVQTKTLRKKNAEAWKTQKEKEKLAQHLCAFCASAFISLLRKLS